MRGFWTSGNTASIEDYATFYLYLALFAPPNMNKKTKRTSSPDGETGIRQSKASRLGTYAMLRAISEGATDAIYVKDFQGRYLLFNNEAARVTGKKAEEVIGRDDYFLFPEAEARIVMAGDRNVMETGRVMTYEETVTTVDGTITYLSTKGPIFDENGEVVGLFGIARNITERKRADEALRESEKRLASIYDTVADVIFYLAVEPEGQYRFIAVNPAFGKVTGLPDAAVVGKTVNEVIPEPSLGMVLDNYQRAIRERRIVRWEETSEYPTGQLTGEVSVMPVFEESGECVHLVGTVHDITERKLLERQLLESQKMESIGRLAGGVAHDFNNYLTAIKGNIDLAAIELPADSVAQAELKSAGQALERAAKLSRQLLLFGNREHLTLVPTNLNHVVEDLVKMLGRLIGESYRIVVSLTDNPGPVNADASHIEQVIMNLVVNARDSMPGGGDIVISTVNEHLDGRPVTGTTGLHVRDFFCLSVADSGVGMDDEIMSHIFEPFFTTKAKESGTGLGLPVVYGIIADHGGWIDVESQPGQGSTFSIYLPAISGESEVVSGDEPEEMEQYQGGGEGVLLVEDDEAIRTIAEKVLAGAGYRVLKAADAEQAMEIFAREQDSIQLVFSDVILPGMNGADLVERLYEQKTDICTILASGYSNGIDWRAIDHRGHRFLEKPYSMTDVLKTIFELLHEG